MEIMCVCSLQGVSWGVKNVTYIWDYKLRLQCDYQASSLDSLCLGHASYVHHASYVYALCHTSYGLCHDYQPSLTLLCLELSALNHYSTVSEKLSEFTAGLLG